MQSSSGEIEPVSSTSEGKLQDLYVEAAIWLIRLGAIIYLLSLVTVLMNDDELRLYILHALTRIFQTLARTFGLWALELEQSYNEYVSTLH
jgi:uncharacterized membrane protein YqjE